MHKILFQNKNTSYPIYIGNQLLNEPQLIHQHIYGTQVCVITNETIAPLYLQGIENQLNGFQCETLLLQDGEQYKTLDTFANIIDFLMEKNFHRDATIIALGGGVIGDISGFAAACFQRGINIINIPTSLLAQVDAAIGGKTAVNHPAGKNMIGAFHQPQAVIIDINTLQTLPEREFNAGIAEIIKYGLIQDANFFNWLEQNIENLLQRDPESLKYAIKHCCAIKATIVAKDEKEQGIRTLLNLGHSFAHVIETHDHYQNWLHGEAVAVGIMMAAELSQTHCHLDGHSLTRIKNLLLAAKLPITPPDSISQTEWQERLHNDKKVRNSQIRLVLLNAIGDAIVTTV